MTISLVHDMITCLEIFPTKNGISSNLSPAAIILGSLNPNYTKLNIPFLAYAKVYIGTTNITNQRTVGGIVLRPENNQSGYHLCPKPSEKVPHFHMDRTIYKLSTSTEVQQPGQ